MISDHDRSHYIGASDTEYVVRNWTTRTFERWYLTKMGLYRMDFTNDAMKAGSAYEHRILDSLGIPGLKKDRQIIKGRLRVNLDGSTEDVIYEVKTHSAEKKFKPSKAYRDQVQVELYATGIRKAWIVAYGLCDKDYANFYQEVDARRLTMHPIGYDDDFIRHIYLPRFRYLSQCLDLGKFPTEDDYGKQRNP